MGPSLDASIALVAIAPFVAAMLAPLVHRYAGPFTGWLLALVPAAIFAFLLTLAPGVISGGTVRAVIGWVPAYGLDLSFFIDGLSLVFALTISGIGTLIILYSGAYLAGHHHQGRFLGFMLAFMGAMLGLVLSDSLMALFMFWELTSITSFLLIGFDHTRQAARRGAIQALVITNIGGMCLLVGAILVNQLTGTWEMSALRGMGDVLRDHALYGLVLFCFIGAAFTKSATSRGMMLDATLMTPTAPAAMNGSVRASSPDRISNSGGNTCRSWLTRSTLPPASLIATIFGHARASRRTVSTPISMPERPGML